MCKYAAAVIKNNIGRHFKHRPINRLFILLFSNDNLWDRFFFFWDVLILGLWYVQLCLGSRHCARVCRAEVMKKDQQLESFIPPPPPRLTPLNEWQSESRWTALQKTWDSVHFSLHFNSRALFRCKAASLPPPPPPKNKQKKTCRCGTFDWSVSDWRPVLFTVDPRVDTSAALHVPMCNVNLKKKEC